MIRLDTLADRVARRIVKTHAVGDDYAAERALIAEMESAGLNDPQASALVAVMAAERIRVLLNPNAAAPRRRAA